MNGAEAKTILDYARAVLKAGLNRHPLPELTLNAAILEEKRGLFVTLKKKGMLRGCIGQILGQKPLRESIRDMTLAAAFEDPRFPSVSLPELVEIRIHISLLTVPVPVRSYQDVRVGTDGIIVSYGRKKGVYLPEVAVETGWDREDFFRSCAFEKAGLDGPELGKAVIEVFQTEGFEDKGF